MGRAPDIEWVGDRPYIDVGAFDERYRGILLPVNPVRLGDSLDHLVECLSDGGRPW